MNNGALPNLIVIGSMKCGTTTLHDFLGKHPDIFVSEPKEINFFSGENSDKSLDWYKAHFNPDMAVRAESSQNYSKAHHPLYAGAPLRIARLIPDIKLIYIVRDPIERYRSHVVENYIGEVGSEIEWIESSNHRILTGSYYYQLSQFLEHFEMNQIMIVDLADLSNDPLEVMNNIFKFLGLRSLNDSKIFDFKSNKNGDIILPGFIRKTLIYRMFNKFFPGKFDAIFANNLFRKTFLRRSFKPELSDQAIQQLRNEMKADADRFRALVGREFRDWSV